MKRYYLLICLILCLLVGCSSPKDPVPATLHPTASSISSTASQLPTTLTPLPPTPSPLPPTATALPPTPTETALPTETPRPTATQAPYKEVEDIDFWKGQELDLYLPTKGNGPYPVVLLLHEGNGRKEQLITWGRRFAEMGYAAVAGNYRGDPNYQYPQDISDAFCMLGWIHAYADEYNLDANQAYALGHSAGGTLAAMLGVLDDPTTYRGSCPNQVPETDWLQGAITFTGIFDYKTAAQSSNGLNDYTSALLGGGSENFAETVAAASAINWIDGGNPPFLVIHGEADHNIPPDQSIKFAAALDSAGVPVELQLMPDLDHYGIVGSPEVFETVKTFLTQSQASTVDAEADQPTLRTEDLRITIIYDNTVYDEALTPEWGFAALIEYNGHTVLFDTGGTSDTFMNNLATLDINPMEVDAVVISHSHGDHTGGLLAFLDAADQPAVYLPATFPSAFKEFVGEETAVIDVTTSVEIYPGIYSTGQISADGLYEQGLVVDLGDEIVVITGCAHPGIVNMVRRGRSSVPKAGNGESKPVALVLGGFHLLEVSRGQVEDIIADLRALDVRQVTPTHCTGEAAIEIFAELFSGDYIQGGAGQVITIPGN